MEGQGIAGRLVKAALDDARSQRLTVVPICRFVAAYIRRHPEYRDMVFPDFRHLVESKQG
jgi:predicted GNAT family acetyltransferase